MSAYSAEVLARFRAPQGAGRLPEGSPDIVCGEARDADGGQRVRVHLRVGPAERIELARFQAFGCPIAIAVASAAVVHFEGATIADALALRADQLAGELALDAEQARLAELPLAALRAALAYLPPRP